MAKIQVLDKHIAELIAAGEVVERPASVIKELTENSIDAGAAAITIEIQRGGISYMRISDNGCGIEKEDVPVAFLRHATSKINTADDLDSISSLGFRGEALASVSAVAHIELTTRTAKEEIGTKIIIHGGDTEYIEDAGCPVGTSLVVRDIFYNVPARMKFMKKDVGEGNAVSAIVDKIALSHPEISFRFIRDKKEVMYTPGDSKLASAIYGVYGKEFVNGLMPVKYDYQGIKLWGYLSKTSAVRSNRTMQNFFINGRFIKSRTAAAALEEGYKGSIMTGKFPACVIHIEMEPSLLDVNVHPAKLDVRFANERPIFDAVYHAVKSALMGGEKAHEFKMPPQTKQINPFAPVLEKQEQIKIQEPLRQEVKPKFTPVPREVPTFKTPVTHFNDSVKIEIPQHQVISKVENIVEKPVVKAEPIKEMVAKETIIEEKTVEIVPEKQEIKNEKPHKFIGEAFGTYIILEYENGIMLIDKHAAHERLLYEKLKKDSKAYAQSLLVPVTVVLDKMSYDAVINHLDDFEKAGFLVEDFGSGSVIVREAPLDLIGQDIEAVIEEMSSYLVKNKNDMTTEYLDWVYHNVACRAAIKGGRSSQKEELIELAKMLEANEEIRHCPHGRPVYVLLKKNEIEKQFGRI